MKKAIFSMAFSVLMTVIVFSQGQTDDKSKDKPKWHWDNRNFNHCLDQEFKVSFDSKTNVVKVIVKALRPTLPTKDDQQVFAGWKHVRFQFFFNPEQLPKGYPELTLNEISDGHMVWQYGRDSLILGDATVHSSVRSFLIGEDYFVCTFKLTKQQVNDLKLIHGIPDDKTKGFNVGNLNFSASRD